MNVVPPSSEQKNGMPQRVRQYKTKYNRFSSNTSINFMKYSLGHRCVRRKTIVLCFKMEHIGMNKVK